MIMDDLHLSELASLYESYAKEGRWDEYISALSEDGLRWWFNMDMLSLEAHLSPLKSLKDNPSFPKRIEFLLEVMKSLGGLMSTERLDILYRDILEEGDLEGACGVCGAGIASIWDSGAELKRYKKWYDRIGYLLKHEEGISPLARASLFGYRALVEMTGSGNLKKAEQNYREQLLWAEKAHSSSLRVFHATGLCYCLFWQGRLSEAEILLSDTAPLCELKETSIICRIYFQITQALFHGIRGEHDRGRKLIEEILSLPFFESLPPPVFYLGYGNLLYVLSQKSTPQEIDEISTRLRKRAIPEQNYFHHSYMHFTLGIAYLGMNLAHKAFIHSEEAIKRGNLSQSPVAGLMPMVLKGQALKDMGEEKKALDHLIKWVDILYNAGINILASLGCVEIADLLVKRGAIERAREYFERAVELMPSGEGPPRLYRPPEFLTNIKKRLYPEVSQITSEPDLTDAPVSIRTFGTLSVKIGNRVVYDRKWRGGRTKLLLKALVVYGGTKIPEEVLLDTIWPDTDGDRAIKNLKVAISRLRRCGVKKDEEPLPWITVRHRQVSLSRSLCAVDSLIFRKTLARGLKEEDPVLLRKALDLYSDDFLVHDINEAWIIKHREILREEFERGVMTFAEMSIKRGSPEDSVPYLQKAIERDPLHEPLHASLMRVYLEMGYPSRALKVFKEAKHILKERLGIEPGSVLISLARKAGGKH